VGLIGHCLYSEPGGMTEQEDFNRSIIQSWILKIHCSCMGCKKKVKKVLRNIDGVYTVTIDVAEQKVTVTGNVASADVLLEKLLASGKRAELWPVAPNEHQKEAKTQKQPEHAAMAQNKHEKEAKTQKQPEHAVVAQSEKENKKLKTQKQPEHAAVAQNEKENKPKTTKQPEEQKSDRHGDNGQVEKDALFTERQVVFKMETLVAATNNFQDDNKLGEGGFGPVYKGTTRDGKQIAVKKLSLTSKQGRKEFLNEKLLAKIQHRNFVNLLGCCKEGSQMFVVYEYLPNGSLDKFLSDAYKRKDFDWNKRYNIILGIASGLRYLHEDSQPRIVHLDIKLSNILLDEKMNPKIADFGLAKLFPDDKTHVSTVVAGTPGYMAPEYFLGEQLSVTADVYSFGVVLLELLTGKRISSEMGLLGRVWSSYKRGKIERTIDKAITETYDKEKASRCIHVGFLCTQADPSRRPTMSGVTAMLSTSVTLPVPTNPPGYTARYTARRRQVNPLEGTMSQL